MSARAQSRPWKAPTGFLVFASNRADEMIEADVGAFGCGPKSCRNRRVPNDAAHDRVERGQSRQVDVAPQRRSLWQVAAPELQALGGSRLVELDHELQSADERRVDVLAEVGGEDRQAIEALEPGQEICGLEIGVPVVRVAYLSALAEQRVRLIEQQDRLNSLGGVEHLGQVLLCLADPLRNYARDVNHEQMGSDLVREHLRGERLAGPRRAGKKHPHPARAGATLEKAPVVQHSRLVLKSAY